jgi:tetratricopeptide (TPR) repeat protein
VLKAIGLADQATSLRDSGELEQALEAYDEAIRTFNSALELDSTLELDPADRAIWCTKGVILLWKSVTLADLNRYVEASRVSEEAMEALRTGSPCEEFGVTFPTPAP